MNAQSWENRFPAVQWEVYRETLQRLDRQGFQFAIGGGLAYAVYAQRWRNTNDLDLFILPDDRQRTIDEVTAAGFDDYYDQVPYDREWIFRGFRDGVILDLIWEMANHHAQVDRRWIGAGPELKVDGLTVRLLPPEELIWAKLYIVQRDRCDWPDLLTILYTQGARLDWLHLLDRVEADIGLLTGLVSVFGWLCPERAAALPGWLWPRLGLSPPPPGPACSEDCRRVARIDSRNWFYPESIHP